jgi:hypothetical protein
MKIIHTSQKAHKAARWMQINSGNFAGWYQLGVPEDPAACTQSGARGLASLFCSSSAHCAGAQTPADVGAVHAGRERCLRRVQAASEQDLRLFKLQQPDLLSLLDDGYAA